VLVGVVASLALPIYATHVWRWLLLWCAGSLRTYHDDFSFVYYNKLYNDKLCLASVGKGEDGGIPSARSVLVVFVRWSKNLFVISFNFRALCTTIDDYQYIDGFFAKRKTKSWSCLRGSKLIFIRTMKYGIL
jgi:hypothetical protein